MVRETDTTCDYLVYIVANSICKTVLDSDHGEHGTVMDSNSKHETVLDSLSVSKHGTALDSTSERGMDTMPL